MTSYKEKHLGAREMALIGPYNIDNGALQRPVTSTFNSTNVFYMKLTIMQHVLTIFIVPDTTEKHWYLSYIPNNMKTCTHLLDSAIYERDNAKQNKRKREKTSLLH